LSNIARAAGTQALQLKINFTKWKLHKLENSH